MTRRQWLYSAAALTAPQRRPNILIVLGDQLPAYALGCAGDPNARTPNLDRLAGEGARFVNAVSNCPVCTPFRAMLQTGRWPLTTGMIANDLRLPESEYTMAEALREAGYQTGYIGKWHLDGPERWAFTPPGPRRQGHQFWAVNNCSHSYMNTFYYRDSPTPIPVKEYEPAVQTRLFQEFLRKRNTEAPFFMTISWGPPHPPYAQIPEALRVFRPEQIKTRPNMQSPDLQSLADFYSQLAAIDGEMGRLLGSLDTAGIAGDTIVLFSADHGDMLSSHGKKDKQIWYDEAVNIPFLLRYPGRIRAGTKPRTMVNVVDVMPTLLSLAGVAIPKSAEGKDLSPVLEGIESAGQDASLIANYMPFARQAFQYPEWRGVRTATHTYVETRKGPAELYDNRRDPYQMKNVVGAPEHSRQQSQLAGRLEQMLKQTADRFEPRENYWKRYHLDIGDSGEVKYTSRAPKH
ncbi:MAG TPA: sulfatase-like hydrolase/transferase [Bryobacteraceae bacterium]|nr:sulfatase-like hydrolase/transferase [Bryobacteraceae bacterium]